jgi:hypothetical protein
MRANQVGVRVSLLKRGRCAAIPCPARLPVLLTAPGMGVFTWQDPATAAGRRQYAGQFCDDKMHGQGVLLMANGDVYTGSFKDDKFHGPGRLVTADGQGVLDGEWMEGEFAAPGPSALALATAAAGRVTDPELLRL